MLVNIIGYEEVEGLCYPVAVALFRRNEYASNNPKAKIQFSGAKPCDYKLGADFDIRLIQAVQNPWNISEVVCDGFMCHLSFNEDARDELLPVVPVSFNRVRPFKIITDAFNKIMKPKQQIVFRRNICANEEVEIKPLVSKMLGDKQEYPEWIRKDI